MTGALLQIDTAPGKKYGLVLTLTEDAIDLGGKSLRWSEIDKVRYGAVDKRVNGAYIGTTYTIDVGSAAKKYVQFSLYSGTTGLLGGRVDTDNRDRNRADWLRALEIVDARVCVRLVSAAVRSVRQGQEVEFAGLRLTPDGVHKGGIFRRSVAWGDVAGTEVKHPYLRVLARDGGKTKKALEILNNTWNAVLLPRVLDALTPKDS
ncbi:hypothetical protein ACTMTJ_40390 [Phytohabitans sp. LJ34]|uniref:hypothetical protein n=1 Tax=Phytohabitans sp. LJ34 TaxID=3452217 RepID=UPI003F8A71A2